MRALVTEMKQNEILILMKRLCSLLLLALLPLLASAYDAKIDGIYYNLDSNKKQAEVTYLTTDYSIKRYVYTGTVNIPEFSKVALVKILMSILLFIMIFFTKQLLNLLSFIRLIQELSYNK